MKRTNLIRVERERESDALEHALYDARRLLVSAKGLPQFEEAQLAIRIAKANIQTARDERLRKAGY